MGNLLDAHHHHHNNNNNTNSDNVDNVNTESIVVEKDENSDFLDDIDIDDIDVVVDDDDDDMSSIMSDVGVLDDIDFDKDYITRVYDDDDDDNNNQNQNRSMNDPSLQEQEQDEVLSLRMRKQRRYLQKREVGTINPEKRQQQQEHESHKLLKSKGEQRQIYLQEQQEYRPKQLLQPIEFREQLSMTLQLRQLQQENGNTTRSNFIPTEHDKTNHHQHQLQHDNSNNPRIRNTIPPSLQPLQILSSSWYNSIYDFVIFECYMTIPAAIVLLFHSIIFIMVYDLVNEIILYTYSDILPTLYTLMIHIITSLPLPPIIRSSIITNYIPTGSTITQYYDTLFYVVLSIIGIYSLHISGYLYWWLSDYDYTLLKYDTHNRIRLLQIMSNPTTATSLLDDTYGSSSRKSVSSTSTESRSCCTRLPNIFVNTFVHQLSIVRQYPIFRMTIYMIGYFIIYMLSHALISTTYPYFSQHTKILPHLPSYTFDKQLYHLVDTDSTLKISSSTSSLPSNGTDNIFPCIVQNCQQEIIRQQRANMELIYTERQYTESRLAYMNHQGYWSTFVDQYGIKSIYPLFDTIQNRYYSVEDDVDEYNVLDEASVSNTTCNGNNEEMNEDTIYLIRRNHTGTIVDFYYTPVYSETGEIIFSCVVMTIGITLLRGYGFIFWQKY